MSDKTTIGSKFLLPKTGQTTSYADYDDGYYQKGSPVSPRFVDNGDGTVTDRVTNLMWVKQPELIIPGPSVRADNQIQVATGYFKDIPWDYAVGDLVLDGATNKYYVCVIAHRSDPEQAQPWTYDVAYDLGYNPGSWVETVWTGTASNLTTPSIMTWVDAVSACASLEYAGHADWRLPNIIELFSTNCLDFYPPIDPVFVNAFPNIQNPFYWSSSTLVGYPEAMCLSLDGSVGHWSKPLSLLVRPVRSL